MSLRRVPVLGIVALALATSCARPVRMAATPDVHGACRELSAAPGMSIAWFRPLEEDERRAQDERCAVLGPPVVRPGPAPTGAPVTRVVIVTWNLHDGRGEVLRLVQDLQRGLDGGRPPDAIVLLLQEVVRATRPPATPRARHTGTDDRSSPVPEVPALVAPPDWHLAYVPARRTSAGTDASLVADRGTAILSSLPLTDLASIELPVERQRRLALAATVHGVTAAGRAWQLRVVSAHLENRPGARRAWVRAGAARTRQAEALLDALDLAPVPGPPATRRDQPLVLGGDLNTWLGRRERALRLLRQAFPAWPAEDTRPTSAFGLRLDHLFARLPGQVSVRHRRLDDRYGSDHHPVAAEIDFGPN